MTLSLVGRCERTGAVGAVIASASMAVAARCVAVRAGVGVACSQSTTDPRLREALLEAMLAAFQDRAGDSLGDRLIDALQADLAAGGEVSPVRSAGMVIAESVPWPVTDLRVDWHDDPVGQLAGLWQIWQPQAESYVQRALRPSEMAG